MAAPASKEALPKPGVAVASDDDGTEKAESSWTYRLYLPLALFFCFVACIGVLAYFGWSVFVDLLFDAVEASEHKALQALVINSCLVVMIVCCLPGPAFCVILDGFFFGFWKGFALGFIAELIGYVICLCLARTCFKARIRQWILESETLYEMLTMCEEDSTGKFLMAFRFISMPVWAKNYSIGMLDIDWLKAILVFIPAEAFYAGIFAYIGSKGFVIADAIRKGDTQKALDSFSGVEVLIVVVSILCMVLIGIFGWREYSIRRKSLDEGTKSESAPLVATTKLVV